MESNKNGDNKRQQEDQEPEASFSKRVKVEMAPSAFNAQSGRTITSVYNWEKTIENLEDEYRFDSDVFGTKKHSFYLRFKEHSSSYGDGYSDDQYSDDDDDYDLLVNEFYYEEFPSRISSRNFNIYLCLDHESLENEVFIEKLFVEVLNGPTTLYNQVLIKDSPLEIDTVKIHRGKYIDLETSLEITFKESYDDWNSYCSRAPVNHAEMLCQQLANITSLSPPDVTLKTMSDGQLFPAHKLILKMRSPVFAAMFSGDFVENQKENPIEIFEVSGPVMKAMLAYVYCKPFYNWEMIAGELAVAADVYNITSLFDACIASLLDDITVENAAKNFYYAQLFNSTNVKGIAKYIDFRKDEVKLTDGWKELNEERGDWLEKQLSKVLNVKKRQIRKRK